MDSIEGTQKEGFITHFFKKTFSSRSIMDLDREMEDAMLSKSSLV